MSRRDTSGRYTKQSNTPRDEDEEDDEIKAALSQVDQDRARNETLEWQWETPLPTINEEESRTDAELEATIEATRQRDELRRELNELEHKVKSSGKKLFGQSTTSTNTTDTNTADDKGFEGALEEVEEMLGAFGDGDTVTDCMDAVERLHARVSVNSIQPGVGQLLGLKRPIGTLDQLVGEVEKQYSGECQEMLAIVGAGGKTVMAAVKTMMSKVMVGAGVCKLLMALVVTKMWIKDSGRRHSQAVKDVIQVLCRTDREHWDEVKQECTNGKMRYTDLTDEDVSEEEGYKRLMPTDGSRKQQGDDWMEVVVVTASLLSYVPVEKDTWQKIMEDWKIKDKNHWCVQKPGTSIREMMFDLRKALKDCRDRLKRIDKQHKESDEEEVVRQMMLAPLPSIKGQVREKMKWEKLHMEELNMVTAVRLLVEAEEELGINDSTRELYLEAEAHGGTGGRGQDNPGGGGRKGADRGGSTTKDRQLENAKAVFAREKGHQKHEVTREVIENDPDGGVAFWAAKYVEPRRGLHSVAVEQGKDLMKKQTEARRQAGGTRMSDKAIDGEKLPLPGEKVGPPVVYQMRASRGWRSRGEGRQPSMHCMRGGEYEQRWSKELVKAVDAVYAKEKLGKGFDAWVARVKCRRAEKYICDILRGWQQQEMQMPMWGEHQQGGSESDEAGGDEESSESSWEWHLQPSDGEDGTGSSEEQEERWCACGVEGDHRCEVAVTEGNSCSECGGICGCTCNCRGCAHRRRQRESTCARRVHWSERDGTDGEGRMEEMCREAERRSYEMIGMEYALMLGTGDAHLVWRERGSAGNERRRREWHGIGVERTGGGAMEVDTEQLKSEAQRLEYQEDAMEDLYDGTTQEEVSNEVDRLRGRRQEVMDAIQAVSRPGEDDDTVRQYLVDTGRQKVEMEPDGNCLFRAMAYSELGDQERYAEMRECVVNWMQEEDGCDQGYLENMMQDGVHGDDMCIAAAGRMTGRRVVILITRPLMWEQPVQQMGGEGEDMVLISSPGHFDATRKVSGDEKEEYGQEGLEDGANGGGSGRTVQDDVMGAEAEGNDQGAVARGEGIGAADDRNRSKGRRRTKKCSGQWVEVGSRRFELVRSGCHMLVAAWEAADESSGGEVTARTRKRCVVQRADCGESTAGVEAITAVLLCALSGWLGAKMVGLLTVGLLMMMAVAMAVTSGMTVEVGWKARRRIKMVGLLGVTAAATAVLPGMHPMIHGLNPKGGDRFKPALGHVSFVGEKAITLGWDTYCEPLAAVRRSVVCVEGDKYADTEGTRCGQCRPWAGGGDTTEAQVQLAGASGASQGCGGRDDARRVRFAVWHGHAGRVGGGVGHTDGEAGAVECWVVDSAGGVVGTEGQDKLRANTSAGSVCFSVGGVCSVQGHGMESGGVARSGE